MKHPVLFEDNPDSGRHRLGLVAGASQEPDRPRPVDSEFFIRRAFETDPGNGYELLFKRYYGPLCSHAARFVYAKETAEDIVADVFGQFWQKQLHRSVTISYRAYLFTTVRHAAFAHLRAEFGRETPTEDLSNVPSDMTALTPQQLLQFNELHLKIDEIIRSVSPQSQKVFIMSRFEGRKNAAIADELHLSIKTVEGHITKVLAVLRQSLRQYDLLSLLTGVGCWAIGNGVHGLFSL